MPGALAVTPAAAPVFDQAARSPLPETAAKPGTAAADAPFLIDDDDDSH